MQQEEKRHRCEVREWMRRRAQKGPGDGRSWLGKVMQDIERKRGKNAAERLRHDIRQQWQLGNRGDVGDWREPS